MDNQDKIFNKIKNAAHKAEEKDFPGMEKVWMRVEEKLDKKEDKKAIVLWKKLAIAASLLLFFSLGYQFLKTDSKITAPSETPQNKVVIEEKQNTVKPKKAPENIKADAEIILKKQIEKQAAVTMASENNSTEALSSADALPDAVVLKDKSTYSEETAVNSPKKEAFISEEKKSDLTGASAAIVSGEDLRKVSIEEVAKTLTGRTSEVLPTSPENLAETKSIAFKEKKSKAKISSSYDATKRIITGIITDETDLPIPGANVFIKGTKKAATTDFDGKFSIQAEKGDQLVFSYIGYKTSYAVVGGSNNVNIKLLNDSVALNEVVVVGYGTIKKSNLTGSVAMISGKDLKKVKKEKAAEALQGYVSGVQTTSSGNTLETIAMANARAKESALAKSKQISPVIRVRGGGSITQASEPLYVVDGIPMNSISEISPNDIKNIDVVKDASSTAIYGSYGANGVVIITTKNGTYQNLSKKQLERKLKKLDKNRKTKDAVIAPKSIEVSQEDYDSFIENQFESPKTAPLSTFSIDVDNASYTNVRRFINNSQTVPKDAVRVEEMINFFKYKYPQPQDQHPFSINTEYSNCPWNPKHQLLKIGLQGKNIPTESLPASNLVFLIDVSGSMSDANKLPLLKQSMKILVNELRKKDKVAIVVYAGAAGMVLPPTSGDEKQTIIDALEKLNAGGSTAGGAGIELAYKLAQENFIKGGNNRVILATDGDFNVGASSNTDMQTLIEEKRKSGVFLTCLGYGMGNYKDSKMETLSDKGNGNYAYIDNIQEANRFLGKEFKGSMFAIAKDVKIQIEFNPKQVQAYRLIGYENRKLRPEDFTNDAIDAGELGSNHTVTALYEVIPAGIKSDFINSQPELKYTKTGADENNYSDELATIKFRYKKPDGDKSIEMVKVIENKSVPLKNSSDDFKFSTAVAWFGLKLRDSNLVPNKSSEEIKKLAKEGLSNDEDGYKAEFIRLVETVK